MNNSLEAELLRYLPEEVVQHLGRGGSGDFKLALRNLFGGTVIVEDKNYEVRDVAIEVAKIVGGAINDGLTGGWAVGTLADAFGFLFRFRSAQILLTFEEGAVAKDLLEMNEPMTAGDLATITRLNKSGVKYDESKILEILRALSQKKTRVGKDTDIVKEVEPGRWIAKGF